MECLHPPWKYQLHPGSISEFHVDQFLTVSNYLVGVIDYDFDQPPSPLKYILGDRNHISFELIYHPNQPILDAKYG